MYRGRLLVRLRYQPRSHERLLQLLRTAADVISRRSCVASSRHLSRTCSQHLFVIQQRSVCFELVKHLRFPQLKRLDLKPRKYGSFFNFLESTVSEFTTNYITVFSLESARMYM